MIGECEDPKAADIFSCAMVLFLLLSGGIYSHLEHEYFRGYKMFQLLYEDSNKFWEIHDEIQSQKNNSFSNEFKRLFEGMSNADPQQRFTIEQIKRDDWFNGEIYSSSELSKHMQKYYS